MTTLITAMSAGNINADLSLYPSGATAAVCISYGENRPLSTPDFNCRGAPLSATGVPAGVCQPAVTFSGGIFSGFLKGRVACEPDLGN